LSSDLLIAEIHNLNSSLNPLKCQRISKIVSLFQNFSKTSNDHILRSRPWIYALCRKPCYVTNLSQFQVALSTRRSHSLKRRCTVDWTVMALKGLNPLVRMIYNFQYKIESYYTE